MIAKKLSKGCDKKLKTEVRKILKNRISEKNKEIKKMRSEWDKTSRECRQILQLSQRSECELNNLRRSELNRVWRQNVDRLKNKMNHWAYTQGNSNTIPHDWEGIAISDEKLEEMFGDQDDEVLIYGGIVQTDNMKQFLRLPAKLKLFNKVVKTKEEVKAEVEATKAR